MNRREVGKEKEDCAAEFLRKQGYVILEQNFRCKLGEIDIIAREQKTLVFVEVKYRTSGSCGEPSAAVDCRKQRIITRVAWFYLKTHGYHEWSPCRFDVVAIRGNKICHYRNAFLGYAL